MKKKICFALPGHITKNIGGAELQVHLISEELLKRGWEVQILTHDEGRNNLKAPQYLNSNIQYFYYKQFKNIRSLEFFSSFWNLLKTRAAVYYQRTDTPLSGAVALYCMIFRKKMIYAIADADALVKKRQILLLNEMKSNFFLKRFIRKADYLIQDFLIELAKKKAADILSQSIYQDELFKKTFKRKTFILPNSFSYENANAYSYEKENIILWVGNCRSIKQPEIFIRLVNEIKCPSWKFVIIGRCDLYKKMFTTIKKQNFLYLGELSFFQTNEWFKKAKIIVNTSKSEGFSNTFIQAWFYKVIILSLNVDPDYLLSKQNLGFFANNNYSVFKNKLQDVCNNYDSYDDILTSSLNYALHTFDLNKNVNSLETIISKY